MPDTKPIPQAPPLVPPEHHSKREGSAPPLDSATSHGPQPVHGKGGSSRQVPTPSLISAIAPPPADAQLTDLLFHDFRRELEREFGRTSFTRGTTIDQLATHLTWLRVWYRKMHEVMS